MASSTAINGTGMSMPMETFLRAPIATYILSQPLASSSWVITPPTGATFMRYAADNNSFLMIGSSAGAATAASTGGSSAPAATLYLTAEGNFYRHIGNSSAVSGISSSSYNPQYRFLVSVIPPSDGLGQLRNTKQCPVKPDL